jgi:uncharacterized protein (DUF983 family)
MPSGNACPRCGNAPLFDGYLKLKPTCTACGLDYAFADSGDGPAVFIMLGGGALVVGLALWLEINYEPPIWLTMAICLPLGAVMCLGLLRPLKAALIHRQYATKAEEARHKS